ncbi:hypothetical protein Cyast_0012 [Cyanobacterium stanieri PCC 7202]|uniref:Uncharacterized protein n=1 Tax=Cyanobacterium stanieri (strain ATCC 29140 / PCC 7202) TaxID=292563 RepID=K9YHN8_CYASC|nr:hypothetical protein Cyast_0012 [Cyanobacterium stanieri PCC 7202]
MAEEIKIPESNFNPTPEQILTIMNRKETEKD